jgi:hypothetical protein
MNIKKKKEHRLRLLLREHFLVDDETRFDFKNGCVEDPDKYRAFVDFCIIDIFSVRVMVECDEDQHRTYPARCECTRMLQIHENHVKNGDTRPLVFVRYNPDGPVLVDGIKRKIMRKWREEALVAFLKTIQAEKRRFDAPLSVVYAFYDTDEDGELCVTAELPPEMINVATIM